MDKDRLIRIFETANSKAHARERAEAELGYHMDDSELDMWWDSCGRSESEPTYTMTEYLENQKNG